MARYAAFLRGVSPRNLQMPALARALEAAGLSNVRTRLSSGNAIFETRARPSGSLEPLIERSLETVTGRTFKTFVRSSSELARMVSTSSHAHPAGTKRVVVLHRGAPRSTEAIPVHGAGWALLGTLENEAFGFYTPGPGASSLMSCLTRRYGDEFTTRTAETVLKCTIVEPMK
jgi:uncharacterized protein (DUF1697 family)